LIGQLKLSITFRRFNIWNSLILLKEKRL